MNLREEMPQTAAFIDAMRQAFGATGIDAAIRAGLRGEPGFYARENGLEVGVAFMAGAAFERVLPSGRWQRVEP